MVVTDAEKTVFISYRRSVSSFIARAIFERLRHSGYDVFMDVESINNGVFDKIILNQIAARMHFLVILTPGTLESCSEPDDWLRREVEHALDLRRNIVPIIVEGFNFEEGKKYLTGKLDQLPHYNGVTLSHTYFNEGIERLRSRFLKKSIDVFITPTPDREQSVVEEQITETANQPPPTPEELRAEAFFLSALRKQETADYDGAIADYTQAILINPRNSYAYNRRGYVERLKGDLSRAIEDYSESIRLNPTYVDSYVKRGVAHRRSGQEADAISDYDSAIELDPRNARAYSSRGEVYFALQELNQALDDFKTAHEFKPDYRYAIAGLAITHHSLGNLKEAQDFWKLLLEKDQRYRDAAWVRKELNWAEPLVEAGKKVIAELPVPKLIPKK